MRLAGREDRKRENREYGVGNPAGPGGGTFLQQAGHGRAVDQRGEASGEDDAAELPSIPVQRSSAVAERDRIQLGQSVAAAGAAEGNWNVVINQFAAAVGEDRRTVGKACPLILAIVGGEPLTWRLFGSMVRRMGALSLLVG